MDLNPLQVMFVSFALLIGVLGLLINLVEPYLPALITQSFRYGKHSHKGENNRFVGLLEVPKAWFAHFYVFAFVWSVGALFLALKGIINQSEAPAAVVALLDWVAGGPNRPVLHDSTSTLVALVLITMQCVRRFYETNFVQIFSSRSKINLSHYLVGYLHYFGAVLAILANAEGFVSGVPASPFSLKRMRFMQFLGILLFHISWSSQYRANMTFVNLRTNQKGEKITEKHSIPQGHLFDFVSSPHMLTEVAMYFAIFGVISFSINWGCVVFWVVSNQFENAWLTHKWYKQNFKNYPPQRKAIIPFIL